MTVLGFSHETRIRTVLVLLTGAVFCGGVRGAEDYSWVRGANYSMVGLPEKQVEKELGYGKRVGLNAVRVWCSFRLWKRDPAGYAQKVRDAVRVAERCGYRTMPILLNGNGAPVSQFSEDSWAEQDRYLREIVGVCRGEKGLLAWDVMNEPDCANEFVNKWKLKGAALEANRKVLWDYLRKAIGVVRSVDAKTPVTVGQAYVESIEATVDDVDFVSFHDYSATRAKVEAAYAAVSKIAKAHGKAMLQTETGCLARANPYDVALEACQRHGCGWFLFELIIRDRCADEHGIFYPDGTVRDPATIAATMGCFRSRDLGTIVPGSANREKRAAKAIASVKAALTETDDGFVHNYARAEPLLEACEEVANFLECCDLVPMAVPPTAKIAAWRKMSDPPMREIRAFAYELIKTLEAASLL